MENDKKWSTAALYGLFLAAVTIIFSLISTVFNLQGGISALLLWAAKLGANLYLLYYFMKRYAEGFTALSYAQSFGFGFILCMFSSIVCAGFGLMSMTVLFPEATSAAFEQARQIIASSGNYTAEQEDAMDSLMNRLPQYVFFFSLIYYIIWGAIATAVMAEFTKKTTPFTNMPGSEGGDSGSF